MAHLLPFLAHAPHVYHVGHTIGLGALALPLVPLLTPLGIRVVEGARRYLRRDR